MERLQAAIAKARAARESRGDPEPPKVVVPAGPATPGPGSTAPGSTAPQTAPAAPAIPLAVSPPAAAPSSPASAAPVVHRATPGSHDVAAAWAGLKEVQISEQVLIDHRIVSTVGRSVEAMEFDRLRTRVMQKMQAQGWTRLAITSPGPGCGKSTIALNLGFGLARQEGARVMIFEMDMRRPSIAQMLGIRAEADFAKVLAGQDVAENHLIRVRENLAIGATQHVARSAELLQAATTAATLGDLQARYQPSITLFDMPPFRVSDDMLSFVGKVDCVLIVAAAGQTTMEELDDCEQELSAQTNVLGVVLNKCRYQEQDGQYYYYG